MHTAELPMMIFTIAAQMCVGAFVVLGVVQLAAARRYGTAAVDRITDPALYAIGPVMVLGLVASMFHMNDVTHTLNVIRHVGNSWLSREIVFGTGFAGLGFLFAAAQWFKWGTTRLRQALALLTAAVGLGLVWSMSMIYYSLVTVPAWHTWATPAQFFTTAFLLGTLAVGTAFMGTVMWRRRAGGAGATARPATADLLTGTLKGLGIAAVALLGVEFLVIPLHIANLSGGGEVAARSAAVFTGAWFVARLVLVFAGAGLLTMLLVRRASPTANPRTLAVLTTSAFALVLLGELIGRSQFYASMIRIGM
ncbi:dimethyl sulfoxide reductase anchor subunit family protein [Georgenia ruanii]|nr:DmsC/YnfH family molybdoenzyme membrane anchor subunit [Georgenia ruanii]MPV87749.1 dimethyl sulfoxide reductase [Georgenia ruanii]